MINHIRKTILPPPCGSADNQSSVVVPKSPRSRKPDGFDEEPLLISHIPKNGRRTVGNITIRGNGTISAVYGQFTIVFGPHGFSKFHGNSYVQMSLSELRRFRQDVLSAAARDEGLASFLAGHPELKL